MEQRRVLSDDGVTLAQRLSARVAATRGRDVPFASDLRDSPEAAGPGTAAAVLIAITDRDEPGIILTQRPDTMRQHAGQVAFPGGRVDSTDVDAMAAALREAHEEIDLPPGAVTIVATLDPYRTVTGFEIVPVLGVIAPDLPLVPHEAEVAAVFEVPLDFATDQANFERCNAVWEGEMRHYLALQWGDHRIWGATAAMLVNLGARLR